jgi:hypothetical protein
LAAALLLIASAAQAGSAIPASHAPHDLWTISSRGCGSPGCEVVPRLSYWHFDAGSCRWLPASHDEFIATAGPDMPTCFFVHGNRISHSMAFYVGWQAYQGLAQQWPADRPLRFVIWSWPSTQIRGQLKDIRYKAYVSDAHGWHLAWLLDQMNPATQASLVGYSYGSRLVTDALHILGGGQVVGRSLPGLVHPEPSHHRAILMAGALDAYSLAPRGRNCLALAQVDEVLVLVNPCDSVLQHYPKLPGILRQGPPAMGYVGATGLRYAGPDAAKVQQWGITHLVGDQHDYNRYLNSPTIMARVRDSTILTGTGVAELPVAAAKQSEEDLGE